MATITQLKQWFDTGKKPTGAQFASLIDSYYHKDYVIPVIAVENLSDTLSGKASTTDVDNLRTELKGGVGTDGDTLQKLRQLITEAQVLADSRSQAVALNNVIFEPNYTGDPAKIRISVGTLDYFEQDVITGWNLAAYSDDLLVAANTYYIYAKCDKSTTSGIFVLSATKIRIEEVPGYYHFILGVLHPVDNGVRGISINQGMATTDGKFIKTGIIYSQSGTTWINLNTGEISGKITFTAGTAGYSNISDRPDINSMINSALDSRQLDGQVVTWYYPYAPTLDNYPASSWTTTALKDDAVGDLFYDSRTTAQGGQKGYKFTKDSVTLQYSWVEETNSGVVLALQNASKAQDTADNKRRVFVDTPTVPYDVGDLWAQGVTGDILRAAVSKTIQQTYSLSDWVKVAKYTDDTVANSAKNAADAANSTLAKIADDNILSPSEKQYVLREWQTIQGENSTIKSQATTYSIATTAFDNAYNALSSYITTNNLLTNLTTESGIVGTTFRSNFVNYYNEKIKLLKSITDAAKTQSDGIKSVLGVDWNTLVTQAQNGKTLTIGGFINTELIQASTVVSMGKSAITVGGRNLLRNSGHVTNLNYWSSGVTLNGSYNDYNSLYVANPQLGNAYSLANMVLKPNTEYTYSAFIYSSVNRTGVGNLPLHFWVGTTPNTTNAGFTIINFDQTLVANTYKRCYVTFKTGNEAPTLYMRAYFYDNRSSNPLYFNRAKIEEGNIISDWTPAIEDTSEFISTAQKAADDANNAITDIASDSTVVPLEKQWIKKEIDTIIAEKVTIDNQANVYAITTEKTNYGNSYTTLMNYINPIITNLTTTTRDINATTFRFNFKDYYDKRQILLKAISDKAKSLADTAQSTANSAQSTANTAKGITDNFTLISGGLISTNTVRVGTLAQSNAGLTGVTDSGSNSIRFWAGSTYENRYLAPFRVTDGGAVVMTSATVTGTINANSGGIGGFTIVSNKLSVGSGANFFRINAADNVDYVTGMSLKIGYAYEKNTIGTYYNATTTMAAGYLRLDGYANSWILYAKNNNEDNNYPAATFENTDYGGLAVQALGGVEISGGINISSVAYYSNISFSVVLTNANSYVVFSNNSTSQNCYLPSTPRNGQIIELKIFSSSVGVNLTVHGNGRNILWNPNSTVTSFSINRDGNPTRLIYHLGTNQWLRLE